MSQSTPTTFLGTDEPIKTIRMKFDEQDFLETRILGSPSKVSFLQESGSPSLAYIYCRRRESQDMYTYERHSELLPVMVLRGPRLDITTCAICSTGSGL